MKNFFSYIVQRLLYATFLVPLVVAPASFIFPFIVPKIVLLRSLIILMLGGYALLLVASWREFAPRATALSLVLLIFLASFAVSTFVGVDPYHSFWDNHERMLGLFTIAHYVLYYFIATSVLKSWVEWKWALRLFLLAGSIVMVVGLLQVGDPDLLLNQGSDRVASTLGNAIYVGGYGLFLFFVALFLFSKEKVAMWRWVYAGLGLLAFLGMIYSGTRGSMLGFLVGLFTLLVGYALLWKERPAVRRVLWAGSVLVIVGLAALYAFRQTQLVSNIPLLGRLLNASFTSGSGSTRLIAWKIAVDSWRERPVFGWGPNNFFYAFNQYYNPRSLEYSYVETWFDNAHNILLNTLTVQGVLGLASYLAIFAAAWFMLWRSRAQRASQVHLTVIGSAFLLAHLVQNVTVFENPTSYLYFMFWLALINRLATPEERPAEAPGPGGNPARRSESAVSAPERPVGFAAIFGVAGAALAAIFTFNIQPARANQKTLFALEQLTRDPVIGTSAVRSALEFNSPHIDDIRSDLARSIVTLVSGNAERLGRERSLELVNLAYQALQENARTHPRDIRNYLSLAQLAQLAAVITNNFQYLVEAEQYLTEALKYSPRRQQLLYSLSGVKAQLGKSNEAIALIEQAITDDPEVGESYWRLAYIYSFLGQKEKALAILNQAKERGLTFDGQGVQVAAQIMASAGATGTPR